MAEHRVERRLVAILAGDVAGYSRLMGADEEGTLVRLNSHRRELLEPTIAEHRGRIVKRTGDGILIEFSSAVDATRCAIEQQRGMAQRNAAEPASRRIELRIGIHVGDIIIDEGDIFGDGVNIAARLEGIAEPGGICISDDAFRQVRGKVDAAFEDAGEQQLKNIAQPVRVYRIQLDKTAPETPKTSASAEAPSIAVLPFQNMSGDSEQEYFVDGIVEDIITGLSRMKWLYVIARNSSFAYKGRAIDVKQVGRELGVRYVLEGSLRKAGDRIRITCQLIETVNGTHVWAERYDRMASGRSVLALTTRRRICTSRRSQSPTLWQGASNKPLQLATRPSQSNPRFSFPVVLHAAALASLGRTQEAKSFARRVLELEPRFSVAQYL